MNDFVTKALRSRKVLVGRDFFQSRQVKCSQLSYGNRFADWTFCPDHLNENSVIYSFGVGEDVSFDLELIAQYNLKVQAFDPSPRSINWIEKRTLPDDFIFHPYGLAGQDGTITFSEPAEANIHSLKITSDGEEDSGLLTHHLPVHRLPTVIGKLGHDRIDILKMDIEGAEYEVIEDILDSPVHISQVLIEFHHRFRNIGIGKTREAISLLNQGGYKIFNVSASGEEISFIKLIS